MAFDAHTYPTSTARPEGISLIQRLKLWLAASGLQIPNRADFKPAELISDAARMALIGLALLFLPAAVVILRGFHIDVLINGVLTLLGYFPGQIHAVWVMTKTMSPTRLDEPAFESIRRIT